jgi:feruloyl esterase
MRNRRSFAVGTLIGPTLATLMVAFASSPTFPADASSGARVVPDLESVCKAEVIQAAMAKRSPTVTVKEVANPSPPGMPGAVASGPVIPGGAKFTAASAKLPAYCQVTGSFVTNPKTGKTANFLATFPATWNGKYLQLGCSGHCGQFAVSNAATGSIVVTNQGYPGQIIEKGYASIATDEGHVGYEAGTWAIKGPGQVDEDAIADFYYRADQVLAKLGKQITLAFYDKALNSPQKLARSYFSGCSGGGRDAFVAAAYFPEEFDGIVGGSAYNLMGGAFQFAAVALASQRSPGARIPPALLAKIDPIVKAKCDRLDGVEDGLIQNPMACDFRPERDLPHCDGNTANDQCFTQEQIETVSVSLSAVTDEYGHVVQPGYAVSELQLTPAPPPRAAAPGAAPATDDSLQNAALKIFVDKNDPNFNVSSIVSFQSGGPGTITGFHAVVPKAEVTKALAEGGPGIGEFPEKADKLIKLNRKFLIWHNLSDQILTPYMSINYYKQLAKTHGGYEKVQNNIRLFGIPGTGHCSMTGVGPNNFDALGAIEDWVEKGKAPDALLATVSYQRQPFGPAAGDTATKTPRTMPLCKFPEMARYSGRGDVNDATNWSCPPNDTSLLKVGESGRQAGVIE